MIVGVIHDCPASAGALQERFDLAAEFCGAFELRLDTLSGSLADIDRDVLARSPRPLILTFRAPAEGGRRDAPDADRRRVLESLAATPAVRWVDVELNGGSHPQLQSDTELVLSVHWPEAAGPVVVEDVLREAARAKSAGASVFKFVVPARSLSDALVVKDALARAPLPCVGIASGEYGELTRLLYRRLGSRWTYGALPGEEPVAGGEGQVTVDVLARRYRASAIGPDWRLFGVLGNPVRQSRGVRRHNAAFRSLGLAAAYLPLLGGPATADLDAFWRLARELPLTGFSVTAPFKQAVLDGLDEVEPDARELGAVNTVVRAVDGRWRGFNADVPGFLDSLGDLDLCGRHVLVLGAGGVACAVAFALRSRQVGRLAIANRTADRADALARRVGGEAMPLDAVGGGPYHVVVNATSAGMAGHEDVVPVDPASLPLCEDALVVDVIYNPAPTRFLAQAAALGHRTLDGRAMYAAQSNIQFTAWTEHAFPALSPTEEF